MIGWEYGNARLRARKAELLDGDDYARLLAAGEVELLLGELSRTAYRPDIEAALSRFRALRRLDEAVRSHVERRLAAVGGFYSGSPADDVRLLLERWDLKNLRTLLRAKARLAAPDEIVPLLVAAGRLDRTDLTQLAAQPGVRGVLDLMLAWRIPTRAAAKAVAAAWPAYEASGELLVLEAALERAFAEHLGAALGPERDDDLASVLRSEIDAANVVAAARLRRVEPAPTDRPDDVFLPAGTIPAATLAAAVEVAEPAEAADLLASRCPPGWRPALAAWADHGDPARLGADLTAALTRAAVDLFVTGDPLGPAVVVAYVWALENESRNLRWIGRGTAARLDPGEIEAGLVVAW